MDNRDDPDTTAGLHLYFREWREWANLTQEQLAERMGELVATVRRVENNEKKSLRFDYLVKFVEIVGCPNLWDPIAGPPGTLPPTYHLLQQLKPEQQEHARRILETFHHGEP